MPSFPRSSLLCQAIFARSGYVSGRTGMSADARHECGRGAHDVRVARSGWGGVDLHRRCFDRAGGLGREGEQVVEAAREVSLEAAERSLLALAFGFLARKVGLGGRVMAGAGDGDDVQGVVELAVAAAVEPVAVALPR